ncbi:MAG: V-type ATPase subunit [Deltaproteobacteria bacterium]|nr:V-type ATPase subunit [Deltaproteobacteria bacterium]
MRRLSAQYAFITAFLKGQEARCLSAEQLDEAVSRQTVNDMLEVLGTTDIGEYLAGEKIEDFTGAERLLWRYLSKCIERLKQFNPPADISAVINIHTAKYDILNIKIALRKALTGDENASFIPLGHMAGKEVLEELAGAASLLETADTVRRFSGLLPYASILNAVKEKDERSSLDGELALEARYTEERRSAFASVGDGAALLAASELLVDLANLQVLFRSVIRQRSTIIPESFLKGGRVVSVGELREFLTLNPSEIAARLERTPYNAIGREIVKEFQKEKDVTAVDSVIGREKLRLLKGILSPLLFSPAAVLWYLFVKEAEAANLRMIFKALFDGIPPAGIRTNLVAP